MAERYSTQSKDRGVDGTRRDKGRGRRDMACHRGTGLPNTGSAQLRPSKAYARRTLSEAVILAERPVQDRGPDQALNNQHGA